ncbi:SRPBCC domain-containing protein [Flavobacterium croceum]|uniref:Uncharacterized protein YndB with AHSA1/START domain n=1 Tax=Flavobacterium croceum DSM 17960 TaxID=1121886 RepID=A0A2S4NAL2_9FLAO|nr:SRPBCC domain-containing protein [Flavobacterium croceum]POS02483.1 uncharacterized protein YndB with AHSA1/START domain [Flavobacterium croceum DSM 17960]
MNKITIKTNIKEHISIVWEKFTNPKHIVKWNNASEDWHTTKAENDLQVGGKFVSRMEAKDGSFGFDFEGVYTTVKNNNYLEYKIADGRNVSVYFEEDNDTTTVTEVFEPENINTVEMQQVGWQAILDNFKKYVETH